MDNYNLVSLGKTLIFYKKINEVIAI